MSRIKSLSHNLRLFLVSKITNPMEHRLNQRADNFERVQAQRTADIIDRTDMILQIFEQRLDQQRREIQALREALAARNDSAKNSVPSNGSSDLEAQPAPGASDVSAPIDAQSPSDARPSNICRATRCAPCEVGVALAAAGFTVVELETEDVWMRSNPAIIELLKEVNLQTENRGDNIFALARKTSAPIERYPKELYVD
jgi:hypothetical protein